MTAFLEQTVGEKPVKWLFCNQVRDDDDSDQDKVFIEKALESGQSACIFKTAISMFPGEINVGYKRKGSQKLCQGLGPIQLEIWSYHQLGYQWRPFQVLSGK